jgi:hypothetical protein
VISQIRNQIRNIVLVFTAGMLGLNALCQVPSNGLAPQSKGPAGSAVEWAKARGWKVIEGDILVDKAAASGGAPRPRPDSLGEAFPSTLWPLVSGVATVYYVNANAGATDPTDEAANANIQTAINTFNADFPGLIQWVATTPTSGVNYVLIDLDASNFNGQCEAAEGYEAEKAQPMNGSAQCTVGTILHEMGHIIGLYHEQSRSDANYFINPNYGNVIKGSWGNFEEISQNAATLGLYDYASVMQYPAYSFSRNGGPVIETIPAGIPLANVDGVPVPSKVDYSAGDKETIERLYGAVPSKITITSNPVGLQIIVDGANVTTPQTYAWALNSTHTVDVASGVQTLTGDIAGSTTSATFYYTYGNWNDRGAQSHNITVAPGDGGIGFPETDPQFSTYSANFVQLVPYTSSTYPSGDGTVAISPTPQSYPGASGTFLVARQQATLTATPIAGWNFFEFNNAPFWLPGGLGANPKTFYVPDTGNPIDTTAEFSNTPVYNVDVTPDAFSSNLSVNVDGQFWYTPVNFSHYYDYQGQSTPTWTAGSTHTLNFVSPELPYSVNSRYAFSSWSDGGAASHTISSLPATATNYVATLAPQFRPVTNFGNSLCGGTATLTPASPTNDGFYPAGTDLTFSATAAANWYFAGWSFDLTEPYTPFDLTATDETLVYVNFNTIDMPLTSIVGYFQSVNAGVGDFELAIFGSGITPNTVIGITDGTNTVYPGAEWVEDNEVITTIPAALTASPANLEIFAENSPAGSDGCVVSTGFTFPVIGPGFASFALSPTSLSFGNEPVKVASAVQTITLTNTGNAPLTLSSAAITGTNQTSFVTSNTCGMPVQVGYSCTLNVAFDPAAIGPATAALTLIANASSGSQQSIPLSGTGITGSAVASFSVASVAFGNQAVGQESTLQTVTLTNTGNANLTLSSIALTGTNKSSFLTSNTCGSSLAPSASCLLNLRFDPVASGPATAALTLTDNASGGSPQSIALSGTGGLGATTISLSPASVAFGNVALGQASSQMIVTLTNTGSATLGLSSIALTGTNKSEFLTSTTCGASLAAGANCLLRLRFEPTANGPATAALTLTDNASGSPQSIALTGTGGPGSAIVSLSATSIAFGNEIDGVESALQTVTLTNTGGSALTLNNISVTGSAAVDIYSFLESTTCGATLAAGANCLLHVRFDPEIIGPITAALTLTDNASGSPQNIALSGTGTYGSSTTASFSPTSILFGNVQDGGGPYSPHANQTVTLTNTGSMPLILSSIALTGNTSFSEANTCTGINSPVPVGGNCAVIVFFEPQVAGNATASLIFYDNATGSPQSIPVSGTGINIGTTVSLSSTSVAFGNESVGVESAAQTVTLLNTGGATLTVSSIALTGANASSFLTSNTCGSSVAVGASCTIRLRFDPVATGPATAALTLIDNATGLPQSITLTGTGQ